MKKLLRPLDVFLLGFSGVVTILGEFKDPFDLQRQSYDDLKKWVHPRFRKTDYYQMTYHALKTGYIEKKIKNGEPYFCLTSKGKDKVRRYFSMAVMQKKKWDRKWRVVIFDIEEKQRKDRDLLRVKLRELGFGMIQESVWISPYNVIVDFREFVSSVGLGDEVYAMEVSGLLADDSKTLVKKIWPLDEINSEYEKLYCELMKVNDRVKISRSMEANNKDDNGKGRKKTEKERKEINKIRRDYLEILKVDPCLPKELLPEDWYGEKVKKLLKI